MSRIAIAGLQLEAVNGDNADRMEAEIDAVLRRFPWVEMVVAAELNACGSQAAMAEPMPGPREARFSRIARRHGIWLVPGSMFESAKGKVYNTTPVIDPGGEVIARYRKLFPWYPYEADTSPGSDFVVFDVPGAGRFGLSTCYDMWFPETLRALTWLGAEVILHPSLTGTIDRQAELAMVRAYAAVFQCYFFDVNLGPTVGCGQSCVAGPGGEVLHQSGRGREIFPLKLDLDYVRDVRKTGWNNLSQPLKSFRDSAVRFPCYGERHGSSALDALGPLTVPPRPGERED